MAKNTENSDVKISKKKSVVWKLLKWIIGSIVALILLIVGGVYYYYNYGGWKNVVRELVHVYGSQATGTDVNIGGISLSLTDGNGGASNITVANPKGYSQDYIIKLGNISVSVNKDSIVRVAKNATNKGIKTETIVINEVRIDKPEVTYELMSLKQNNVSDILANLNKSSSSSDKKETQKDSDAKTYNVAIKKVVIADASATVAANLLGSSQSLTLNLPTVTVTNLGTEKQGITIESSLIRIFQEILKTTQDAVAKVDLSKLLNGVGDLAGAAVDTAGKTVSAAVDGAGEVAGAAIEGTGQVAGAVVDGAGAAVDSVANGVKGLSEGVGGLFK